MSVNSPISIFGFGRVGSHLYYSLKSAGFKQVFKITRESKDSFIQKTISKSSITFICTKDGDITNAVKKFSLLIKDFNKKIIFHTSGALNSDLLIPLKRRGATIGSFHPVQTFNNRAKKNSNHFKNIYIAIEGEKKALKTGQTLASKLGSKTLSLSKKSKIFHHICCVICSNYLVTLLAKIDEITEKSAKLDKDKNGQINGFNKYKIFNIYKPLLMSTINNVEIQGSIDSLTGPIERNDLKTIDAHIKTLRKYFPESKALFSILGIENAKLALKKGSINKSESKNIISKFGFSKNAN